MIAKRVKTVAKNPTGNPEPASRPRQCRRLLAILLFSLLSIPAFTEIQAGDCRNGEAAKRLVLIIDDMGNQLLRGQRALQLPGRITYAIIPYTPFGRQLAEQAAHVGKEVMLHAPMSNLQDLPLGRGGLTAEHSKHEFRTTLAAALEHVPQARGINNHMGSELTQRRQQMAWLMQELRSRAMYFVDSRTSERTVAATVAAEFNVPHLSRHVFLDNERSREAIEERFAVLLGKLKQESLAVGIGHPYPETITYLEETLPGLKEHGIELAFVSDVLQPRATFQTPGGKPSYSLTSTPCLAM